MFYRFQEATEKDAAQIWELYQKSREIPGCTWNEYYPTMDRISGDMERHALFVLKNGQEELVGCISIDDDPMVQELTCWSDALAPRAELARLAVVKQYQNQGIAVTLIQNAMQAAKGRGYKSVCYLVSKHHERALRSYKKLHFEHMGETDLFDQEWWCYEKEL